MKVSDKRARAVQTAVKALKKHLAKPLFGEGADPTKIDIELWHLDYGGVRVSEISYNTGNSGIFYSRYDTLFGVGAGIAKLLLLCEEFIVLTAYGDEAGDLPDVVEMLTHFDAIPKMKGRPRCEVCWRSHGMRAPAEFLAAQSSDQGKTRSWVRICRTHREGWNDAGDWAAPVYRLDPQEG